MLPFFIDARMLHRPAGFRSDFHPLAGGSPLTLIHHPNAASAFSEQMRRKRESLQLVIDDALEDGNIDLSELRTIQELGRTLGLSESQIVDLVKHSRNIFDLEHQDRGKT